MAKTKPIGVRFPQEMIIHFNEVHKIEGHQMMVNYLWMVYAQKAGLLNGAVSVNHITKPEEKTNYTINTLDGSIPPHPKREDFPDSFEYGHAKNEWKKKYNL